MPFIEVQDEHNLLCTTTVFGSCMHGMQVHVAIYLLSDCVLFHELIDGSPDSLAIVKKKKKVLKPSPIVPGLRV